MAAEEPDLFEPDGINEMPIEPLPEPQEDSEAPECPRIIAKPFYVEEDSKDMDNSEPRIPTVPQDTTP